MVETKTPLGYLQFTAHNHKHVKPNVYDDISVSLIELFALQ